MKKVISLLMALLLVFTLSACTDDEAMLDLTETVNNLQTQLNASDVGIEDLEDVNTALQLEVDALNAEIEAAKADNDALGVELTELQADLDDAQLLLTGAIEELSALLASSNTSMVAQLAAVAAEFDLALEDISADFQADLDAANQQINDLLEQLAVFELPIIYGVEEYTLGVYEDLSPVLKGFDIQDGDVSANIVATTQISWDYPGEYTVTYEVEDNDGHIGQLTVDVTVSIADYEAANYLSGVDLSKLDVENKGRLFAALENYMLDNVYGGVPLYTSAARVMYADRVNLFSPEFNGVLGFGTDFSQFTDDDSTVFMYDDVYGQAGENTWRASYTTDPVSLNPWLADDGASSDFNDLMVGSLYTFYFDASKTGFEVNADLAEGDPIPVNPTVENGKTYATVWQIALKDGLQWKFHPDTDVSNLPAGYEELTAEDYLWTYKYALDNTWFRAISGGGDFITEGIKNAAEYVSGDATWDEVGLKIVDGNLQFEYTSEKTMFDIKYTSWNPINEQLFTELGPEGYGLTPETVASTGIYYFDVWTPGQLLTYKKNELHPNADMYHYTGQQFRYIETDEQRFEEFLAGRLDSSSIPSARIDEFISDPRVKVSPGATTWRLQINSFGTEENRDAYIAQYPEFGLADDFVPEPILQYVEMRKALFFGFDRYEAAVNVVKTYLPAYTYFASTYFLDADSGTSVRGTVDGAATLEKFGGGTYGYVPDAAVAYFKSAVDKGIADGFYTKGTADNYTTIELSFTYASSGNTGAQNMVAELEQQYETLLVDDVNFVNIDIVVADVAFPDNYYSFMMIANTDLGIGGISGSLMDAPSFLDVFNDDNVGGFTLNWGIDTHSVNIPVVYNGLDGETVSELWSYNALVAALNGKEYIADGVQQTVFDSIDGLVNAYVDMAGSTVASSTDGADLAQYILGSTVAEYSVANGYDAAYAYIVVTEDGGNMLFVISEIEGGFELVAQHSLFTDAESAIIDHSGYASYFLSATGPMTDADVVANAYLSGMGTGYTTVAEWAADAGAPVAYTELWDVAWDGWSDAYVVLHIGDYYVGWLWL